eukprot:TRINITY_DN80877_c0_g1_i1.p1 TRINITY_DN80877_c0_g1~~TRINITY_DN80877_c0_g1_i1.p1  ORF type:complete len:375 (+),score=76.42 TRINITY_DN80877_c0_g1_i1:117-1241(+)
MSGASRLPSLGSRGSRRHKVGSLRLDRRSITKESVTSATTATPRGISLSRELAQDAQVDDASGFGRQLSARSTQLGSFLESPARRGSSKEMRLPSRETPRKSSFAAFSRQKTKEAAEEAAIQMKATSSLPMEAYAGTAAQASEQQPPRIRNLEPLLQERAKPDPASSSCFTRVVAAAKANRLPVSEAKREYDLFQRLNPKFPGPMARDVFEQELRKRCGLPHTEMVPNHLWPQGEEFQKTGLLSFEDFVGWWATAKFSEEVLVPNDEERRVRQAAREMGISILEIEAVRKIFDGFDLDKNGILDKAEFKEVLLKLLNAKDSELSFPRIQRYWRQVDVDNNGSISFYEFMLWYYNSFLIDGTNALKVREDLCGDF